MRSSAPECWLRVPVAERHLQRGDVRSALQELDRLELDDCDPLARVPELPLRARVLEASGQTRAALAAWRRYREPERLTARLFPLAEQIVALYEMGRLAEQLGDAAAARGHYREFLDHWGEVDLPVARVDEARARLAALGN